MRRIALMGVVAVLLWGSSCSPARGQSCEMIPLFSTYVSVSATGGTTITSYVEVNGYADIMPAGCNLQGVTHQGSTYNQLSTTGGWVYGTPTCPSCYISVENSQSISGSPTGTYPLNWGGYVICSRLGTLYSDAASQSVTLPSISGPNTFWSFNGQSPAGYATSISLTSTGGASTTWSVPAGANKVHLSSTSGASITVSTSGTAFSNSPGDIQIVASIVAAHGVIVNSLPFEVTSRVPFRLVPGQIVTSCDPTWGYATLVNYTMQDNLLTIFPSTIGVNEAWTSGITADYSGMNWIRGAAAGVQVPSSEFADLIQGETSTYFPTPNCNGPTTPVYHWGQEWYIGSTTSGAGSAVQTDTLQKYINSALHLDIQSPVTAP